jgi:hypothetical protein
MKSAVVYCHYSNNGLFLFHLILTNLVLVARAGSGVRVQAANGGEVGAEGIDHFAPFDGEL